MEKLLAEVAAELIAEAKPGWDYLTLRAMCDSGYTSHRLSSEPSEHSERVRHLKSLVALGADGNVVVEMRVEPDGAFTALLTDGINQNTGYLPPSYTVVLEPRPRHVIPPYERTEVTSTGPLAAVEAELGVPLPAEVHDLYRSGVTEFGDHTLLPANEILTVRQQLLDNEAFLAHDPDNWAEPIPSTAPRDAVRLVGHHPLWVPIVRYPSGAALCVDLAPGPRGRVGQVVGPSLGCYPLELLADSVTEWHRSPERSESSGMKGHFDVTDYEVDVVASRQRRGSRWFAWLLGRRAYTDDLWVECKDTRVPVSRESVAILKHNVDDVRRKKSGWKPTHVYIVASGGFDQNALRLALSYGFRCFAETEEGFREARAPIT